MSYKFIDEGKKHVHTFNGSPLYGTSSVCGILAKELTWWASGMAVGTLGWTATQSDPAMRLEVAGIALEDLKELDASTYLKRLDLAYKAHSAVKNKAATKGTDMHAELEKYVLDCIANNKGNPDWRSKMDAIEHTAVKDFRDWAVANVAQFIFAEQHAYSKELWVGGIIDCVARLKTGELAVIDFKSSKEVYFNHLAQVGGYALLLEESGALTADGEPIQWRKDGEQIEALVVVPFGAAKLSPLKVTNVQGFKDTFRHLVEIYKFQLAFKNRNK